jgi:hypothetical protein
MSAHREPLSVAQRLDRFGLADRESTLKKLYVKEGAETRISPDDPKFEERISVLKPRSANDLKRWLGIPSGAIGQKEPARAHKAGFIPTAERSPFAPHPELPIEDDEAREDLLAYVLSNSIPKKPTEAEKQFVSRLNDVVRQHKIAISVFLASDIHVEEGATLILNKKLNVLFGNHIIVEDGAKIIMESPFPQIDCGRLRYVRS